MAWQRVLTSHVRANCPYYRVPPLPVRGAQSYRGYRVEDLRADAVHAAL
ncbi:MAG TPA: hypothetical protein VD834_02260 [Blastococcus sp.]|nr:hypothetical protein [Blastococcus sp.]